MNTSTSTKPIQILIVEDHELVRQGLVLTLQKYDHQRFHIVAQAENGQQAIEFTKQFNPDIVLMDIGMPILNGIDATREIKTLLPATKVIMLTSHQDEEEVIASLGSGAEGYCLKDIKIDRLCQVIEMVLDGMICLDPAIARTVMQALPHEEKLEEPSQKQTRKRYNTDLTEREMEVLKLIVAGKSNKEIVQELEITLHTVKAHVSNVIQKLAVDDRTQVAIKALKEGLIE